MWRELYQDSHEFIGPRLVRSLKTFPLSFDHIADALHGAKSDNGPSKLNYFRGYVGGREDYSLAEKFLRYDVTPNRIERSISDAFGGETPELGENAGLIVNGSLQWSDRLQEASSEHAHQIASIYVSQQITFDVTLFIGAYGSTPFGVHIDDASHRTILFNLGPGDKGMAIWRNQDILEQFGKVRNILDPASIKAAPERFFFKTGEAFVLPSERYHVGLNSTLSTTAAIVVDIVSDGKAAAREAQSLGSFFDAMPEPKKAELRVVTFEDLSRLNGLRSSSNHFLRFARAKRSADMSGISEGTLLRRSKLAGIEVAALRQTSIVYSRGYHHVYEWALDPSTFETLLRADTFDVKGFLSALPGGGEAVKAKLLLLKFFIETGTFEVSQ
ncbi:hypothetical protein B7H23_12795 [Notoacmeibacter marinus]|uniref:JmjC domain-containing protein n=1 Tax=Notoacmeibacter marinus TaxID=1876515 RepID=A0A231UT00_9HYPH|nr:hypothetical protein [Notoacmeibacter marinus]OXS99078.1 hypothetical protein B7H23_12795 [Notoacmeibacter marinus]